MPQTDRHDQRHDFPNGNIVDTSVPGFYYSRAIQAETFAYIAVFSVYEQTKEWHSDGRTSVNLFQSNWSWNQCGHSMGM